MSARNSEHVRFLNAYYSKVCSSYDLTRKYFLLGRNALLEEISTRDPRSVVEVGCGTGRNLGILRQRLPAGRFGAVEPCDCMRICAAKRYPWIAMSRDLAEEADLRGLLGQAPDVIFFSYSLSMIQNKEEAMDRCLEALAPGGRLYVLDFGDLKGLGQVGRTPFHAWLRAFRVYAEGLESIWARANELTHGPLRYWTRACYRGR